MNNIIKAMAAAAEPVLEELYPEKREFMPAGAVGAFADPLWHVYKKFRGIGWDKAGGFLGAWPKLEIRGGRDYAYRPDPADPFRFVRHTGETVVPGAMVTDSGSCPRAAWAIPGFDPWTYGPAFLIHDWEFVTHHCNAGWPKPFEAVNDTLGEAIVTLMVFGNVPQDWRKAALIVAAVNSFVGRRVWDTPWTEAQCRLTLNP